VCSASLETWVCVLQEGYYDLDESDIQGAMLSEMVDDGKAVIAANQLHTKFQTSASAVTRAATLSAENATLEQEAEMQELEGTRPDSDQESCGLDGSDAEDDDLAFVRDSVLMMADSPKKPARPSIRPPGICCNCAHVFPCRDMFRMLGGCGLPHCTSMRKLSVLSHSPLIVLPLPRYSFTCIV
jgi:hypothetical protein